MSLKVTCACSNIRKYPTGRWLDTPSSLEIGRRGRYSAKTTTMCASFAQFVHNLLHAIYTVFRWFPHFICGAPLRFINLLKPLRANCFLTRLSKYSALVVLPRDSGYRIKATIKLNCTRCSIYMDFIGLE